MARAFRFCKNRRRMARFPLRGFSASRRPDILIGLRNLGTRFPMARRQDNKAWSDFVAWCQRRGLDAVPANSWTIAAYARWCEARMTPRAIAKAIKDISSVHADKTRKRIDRDPLVLRTLAMIERHRAEKKPKPKVDLFEDEDALAAPKPRKRPAGKAPAKTAKTAPAKSTAKAGAAKAGAGKTGSAKTGTGKAKADAKQSAASRLKRGLSATPRLVSKRKLKS
jgi:hypothetical protein